MTDQTTQPSLVNPLLLRCLEDLRSGKLEPEMWNATVEALREATESFQTFDRVVVVRIDDLQDDKVELGEKRVRALFESVGFEVKRMWRLENPYWPAPYVVERAQNPWWLVETEAGLIQIGRRKRVFAVDWSDTRIRKVLTKDEVTKSEVDVHAWNTVKLFEYLTALKAAADEKSTNAFSQK